MPSIQRMRLQPVRRNLTVRNIEQVTPRMVRIFLFGEELATFNSPSPDDHVKIFFPVGDDQVEGRDYTPRFFDADACVLAVEFFLHEGGVGSSWAQQARPGDPLQIGGPKGSTVISAPGAWWLLIGDETALPSIARRLKETAADTEVIAVLAVTGPAEEQRFETDANLTLRWIHRPDSQASLAAPFLAALSQVDLPSSPGFIWIAAEAGVTKLIRDYAVEKLKHPPEWIKASAYWSHQQEQASPTGP